MTFSPGDLVLIPFPYSNLRIVKKRPVLMLTAPDQRGDFVGLAVTSVPQPEPQIPIDAQCLSQGHLPKASWVRVDKIFTLEQNMIQRVFGSLDETTLERILVALCRRIGHT